jgi:TDG/mug DNA glycosylase family protein
MNQAGKPTPQEVAAAGGRKLDDVIGPGLRVLFCGINPGLYSAAIGHHFGRPGNRFWPALHAGGFTPRRFWPYEERDLLALGLGLTNLVPRATAGAAELTDDELRQGRGRLERKVRRWRPAWVAFLSVGAYRTAFDQPEAALGLQPRQSGDTRLWVLPSPSGLNAHYRPDELGRLFAALRAAVG